MVQLLPLAVEGEQGTDFEVALCKSCLQSLEFVLVHVNRELLYLRRCIQRLNYLLDFAAGQRVCVACKEVDSDERFRPAWNILQFGSTLDSLLNDFESVTTIGNAVL